MRKKQEHNDGLAARISRIEKKISTNEQFAGTMVDCLMSQTLVNEAIREIVRRSLMEDAVIHDELTAEIRAYDKAKFRRAFSGFLGVLMWVLSVASAALVGAIIHWVFSGGADNL